MKAARITLAAGVAAVLLAGTLAAVALLASRATHTGALTLAGLRSPVTIRFDERARPFVRAKTEDDALFVQGFLHARERLWQMELLSRAGRGRLAEMLGRSLLDTDRELWLTGVPQLALRLEAQAGEATRRRVERYVAGVNAGLSRLAARPPELLLAGIALREWTPGDVFAIGAAMAANSARNSDHELMRWAIAQVVTEHELRAFLPDESQIPDLPYVVSRRDALRVLARRDATDAVEQALFPSHSLGSNGWAVAPQRSASGNALFAFDSHDGLALPNLFYEVHLFFEGRSIRGWSVPGFPGVINGFNDHMAWGFTNIGDSQDFFLETRDPNDALRFLGPDGWYTADTEDVLIPVRGAEPERLRIVHTRHGPLVEESPPLSLAWSGQHTGEIGLDAIFELNLATDWEATSAALDRLAAPSANATYADTSGRVAVRTVGLLPVRGRGEGLIPIPGHEAGSGWQGFVPMSALPRKIDPTEGFVAAANARVSPPGVGPLVSADNAAGYRIGRIQDVLGASASHTPEGMRALQMDWRNGQAERLLPTLLRNLGAESLDATADAARQELVAWQDDFSNAPDSPAPLVFLRWYLALAEELFAERLGDELYARLLRHDYLVNLTLDGLILRAESDTPWWRGDRSGLVRRAFTAAVAGLEGELGASPSTWRWDSRHHVMLRHELASALPTLSRWLDRGPYPWGGGHATVGRARSRYSRPEHVTSGATVRVVIEMSDPMKTWAILPGGQAGHPLDRHYDDQIGPWLRGEQDRLFDDFNAASGRTLKLLPTL